MNDPYNRQNRSIVDVSQFTAPAAGISVPVAVADRGTFIIKTYAHLFGAILAFIALEAAWFSSGMADTLTRVMVGRASWLLVLGGFVVTSWLATRVAFTATSLASQYLGLAAYVVAESLIFVPILYIADRFAPGTISSAALATGLGFGGLTLVAFGTRKVSPSSAASFAGPASVRCWPSSAAWPSASPSARSSPSRWWPSPARRFCMTRRTCSSATPKIATSGPRCNCSRQWP